MRSREFAGQATIPKYLRKKFGFKDRALVIESPERVLLKPLPEIAQEKGSLRALFHGETASELIDKARSEDRKKEELLELR